MTHRLHLPDEAATEELARALATTQPESAVVFLQGDLGAGKSTLARAWLRALGVHGAIRSPTYTLVERYPLAAAADPAAGERREAVHLDLYRIGDAAELEFLGLDDPSTALWLVEWPERGARALPAPDLQLMLSVAGRGRDCELVPASDTGGAWLATGALSGCLRRFAQA